MEVSLKADCCPFPGRGATTMHLGLVAFVSAVLMLAPPRATAQCVNLAGNWNGSESGTITLVLIASDPADDDNETDPVSGGGEVTITQTGQCTFQYPPIALNGFGFVNPGSTIRTVSVSGNNVQETGIFVAIDYAKAAQEGVTVTSVDPNVENGTGQVVGDVLTLSETGDAVVTGYISSGGQNVNFTLTITAATTATLVATNPLTLSVISIGGGTVTSTDGAINCGFVCSSSYVSGAQVTLNATPASGGTFLGWSGTCSGTGSCNVTMTQNLSVGATFTNLLTVSTSGSGTVTSTDSFITCPGACSHSYPPNSQVTLNATPNQNWEFGSWSGACSGSGACKVTMAQAQSVGARFIALDLLTVSTLGSGQVTSTDNYINCPGTCTHYYPPNTQVTLNTAPVPPAQTFSGWCAGPCGGTGSCSITMTQDQSVGALFTPVNLIPEPGGPHDSNLDRTGQPASMYASFTPTVTNGSPLDLVAAAKVCGFTAFDWQQTVDANKGGVYEEDNLKELRADPTDPQDYPPFLDPPRSGYTYQFDCIQGRYYICGRDKNGKEKQCPYPPGCDTTGLAHKWLLHHLPNFADAYPFYYSVADVLNLPGCEEAPLNDSGNSCGIYITSEADLKMHGTEALNFFDMPSNSACQDGRPCQAFATQLVAVCAAPSTVCNLPTVPPSALLYQWTWESNFNSGLGTGCVWITSENGNPVEPKCR